MRVLHVLDHSLPLHSGYTFRTRAIMAAQSASGLDVRGITGLRHTATGIEDGGPVAEVAEGLLFHRTDGGAASGPAGMREHARNAGSGDLAGRRSRGDCWRDAVKDHQRRRQEPAADAEHARKDAHAATQQDDDQRIHRQIGYGKIYIHDRRIDPKRISRQDKG